MPTAVELLLVHRSNVGRMPFLLPLLMPSPLRVGALSDDVRLTSVCLTSDRYIVPKSRTERPMKTKIGTEVAHITRDSDTAFKVTGQGHRGGDIAWPHSLYEYNE